ncbi:hypothetical protein [Chitinophaga sp. 212800010-3]|uniref:hypothetical protein n=1 Tax=unclassified Chitinophaga TaxID=2619133 RepID=UPI002DEE530C|nr:DUF1835 domain-containing protein [Chitinophaga sp. 212800010-3]
MSYLNVLNGDAVLTVFRESGIPGEVVICREMMCEGKAKYTTHLPEFFESRAKHLEFHYGIDKQSYYTNVVQELEKLYTSGAVADEIILWFEYDLFCQVNLLFVLYYLSNRLSDLPPISIADLTHKPLPADLVTAFEERVRLDEKDLGWAAEIWEAWCMKTPQPLEVISKLPSGTGRLKYMPAAINAHLKRFPDVNTGLSIIENYFLLHLVLGSYRWYELYRLFWNELEIYGFGDFQLDLLVRKMVHAGVVTEEDQMLKITSLGREILEEEENYLDYISQEHRWLGGVRLSNTPWRWDEEEKGLVEIRN